MPLTDSWPTDLTVGDPAAPGDQRDSGTIAMTKIPAIGRTFFVTYAQRDM
jgi:hypothetical protein